MKYLCLLLLLTACCSSAVRAQELYPVAEPASTVPKGALGVRLLGEGYREAKLLRSLTGIRAMYGITPRFSVYATATFSDFHERTLPFDFISHHGAGAHDSTVTPRQGVRYPYVSNSIDIYLKYRFLSRDGVQIHFRMAAYAEASYVAVPSHEAEPDLLMHTSGWGGGVIATYLRHRFAVSGTLGAILPDEYTGNTYDSYGGIYPTRIHYGRAVNYSLSLGYLLWPRQYKGYGQTGWNIYCEFTGKTYGAAKVSEQYGTFSGALIYNLPITTPILKAGSYLEVDPGLQCIVNATWRMDASVALPLINRSYGHLYPMYRLGVQRYFYFRKKSE